MNCPRCAVRMLTRPLGGATIPAISPYRSTEPLTPSADRAEPIVVDRCPRCRGIWFDAGEMARALRAHELGPPPEPTDASRTPRPSPIEHCPRCKGAIETRQSRAMPSVTYDRCAGCDGVWFDRGEADQFDEHAALLALMLHEFG